MFLLEPFTDEYLAFSYALASETAPEWLRMCARGLPLPTTFAARLYAGVSLQFVVLDAQRWPLGMAALLGHDQRNRCCLAEVQMVPVAHQPNGYLTSAEAWATSQLLGRGFDLLDVVNIYMERVAWNPPVTVPHLLAAREALVPDLIYHQGAHWDVSVTRFSRPEPRTW